MNINYNCLKKIQALVEKNNLDASLDLINDQILIDGQNPIYHNVKGFILLKKKFFNKAIIEFKEAISHRDDFVEAHSNLGIAYKNISQFNEALIHFEKALIYNPNYIEAKLNAGILNLKFKNFKKAIENFKSLIKNDNKNSTYLDYAAETEYQSNNVQDAISYLIKSLELKKTPEKLNQLGIYYLSIGENQASIKSFKEAIDLKFNFLTAFYNLITFTDYKLNQNDLNTLKSLNYSNLDNNDSISFNFIFYKHYELEKKYSEAFKFLLEGNKLIAKNFPFNSIEHIQNLKKAINTFEICKKIPSLKPKNKKIIFIVGMPRCGSSMVEKIISSNKNVYALGETSLINKLIRPFIDETNKTKLTEKQITNSLLKIKLDYYKKIEEYSKNLIFIDKSLSNYLYVGLLTKIFPESKIININRDFKASFFSCFKSKFANEKNLNWTFNPDSIIDYYKNYIDIIKLWNSMQFKNFINIDYEKIIAHQESEFERIFNWIDIKFEKKFLNLKDSRKITKTASMSQVNKNIYSNANEEWKKYEEELNPFFKNFD